MVSLSLKRLINISTIRLVMNVYEPCILVLDEEPCKMEVLQWKWLMMIIIIHFRSTSSIFSLVCKRLVNSIFIYFFFHFIPEMIIEGIAIMWRLWQFMCFDKTWIEWFLSKILNAVSVVWWCIVLYKNSVFMYIMALRGR